MWSLPHLNQQRNQKLFLSYKLDALLSPLHTSSTSDDNNLTQVVDFSQYCNNWVRMSVLIGITNFHFQLKNLRPASHLGVVLINCLPNLLRR